MEIRFRVFLPLQHAEREQRYDVSGFGFDPDTAAFKRELTVLDGLGMLVNQGVIGIKYWTDVDVDPEVMRKKLEDIFGA